MRALTNMSQKLGIRHIILWIAFAFVAFWLLVGLAFPKGIPFGDPVPFWKVLRGMPESFLYRGGSKLFAIILILSTAVTLFVLYARASSLRVRMGLILLSLAISLGLLSASERPMHTLADILFQTPRNTLSMFVGLQPGEFYADFGAFVAAVGWWLYFWLGLLGYELVHLVRHHTFERDIAILDDDVDRRHGAHLVAL